MSNNHLINRLSRRSVLVSTVVGFASYFTSRLRAAEPVQVPTSRPADELAHLAWPAGWTAGVADGGKSQTGVNQAIGGYCLFTAYLQSDYHAGLSFKDRAEKRIDLLKHTKAYKTAVFDEPTEPVLSGHKSYVVTFEKAADNIVLRHEQVYFEENNSFCSLRVWAGVKSWPEVEPTVATLVGLVR